MQLLHNRCSASTCANHPPPRAGCVKSPYQPREAAPAAARWRPGRPGRPMLADVLVPPHCPNRVGETTTAEDAIRVRTSPRSRTTLGQDGRTHILPAR
jgi:hypothetical protein